MLSNFNINRLYKPVQPTVKQTGQSVTYSETLPEERLQNIIYCYWELKTTEQLESSFIYKVVADGCIDIFFQLDNPSQNFIMGFCKQYTEFPLNNIFHYVGIRFLPSMFPMLFDVDANELSNRLQKLEPIAGKTSSYITNNFTERDTIETIKSKFDSYFLRLTSKKDISIDTRFQNALHLILANYGVLNLKNDLNIGLSARQLRRYFNFYIGVNPKTLSQVVRFQYILNAKPSTKNLRQNKLYFDLGYYDQAHFIKEFKNYYGTTPGRALR